MPKRSQVMKFPPSWHNNNGLPHLAPAIRRFLRMCQMYYCYRLITSFGAGAYCMETHVQSPIFFLNLKFKYFHLLAELRARIEYFPNAVNFDGFELSRVFVK
jgi:hypothetical protein